VERDQIKVRNRMFPMPRERVHYNNLKSKSRFLFFFKNSKNRLSVCSEMDKMKKRKASSCKENQLRVKLKINKTE